MLTRRIGVSLLLSLMRLAAQPAAGPDPRAKPISTEELSRSIGGPLLITMDFQDARPEQVYAALAQQAGMVLDPYQTTDLLKTLPPMTVSIHGQPFLPSLRSLAAQRGLHFRFSLKSSGQGSRTGAVLELRKSDDPRMEMDGPVLDRDPFFVIATSIQSRRTVGMQPAPAVHPALSHDEVFLDFVILADPKLSAANPIGSPRFEGGDGWRIESADQAEPWNRLRNEEGSALGEWRFTAHRDRTKTPAMNFKATAGKLLVVTKSEVWTVPDVLNARNLTKDVTLAEGGRRYVIESVEAAVNRDISRRGEAYTVRLSVSGVGFTNGRSSGWPEVSAQDLINSFRLVDSEGVDFAPYTFELKDLKLTASFWNGQARGPGRPATGKPAKAMWTVPSEIREVRIPVEFSNLPVQ